jgi:hypothetical protein
VDTDNVLQCPEFEKGSNLPREEILPQIFARPRHGCEFIRERDRFVGPLILCSQKVGLSITMLLVLDNRKSCYGIDDGVEDGSGHSIETPRTGR